MMAVCFFTPTPGNGFFDYTVQISIVWQTVWSCVWLLRDPALIPVEKFSFYSPTLHIGRRQRSPFGACSVLVVPQKLLRVISRNMGFELRLFVWSRAVVLKSTVGLESSLDTFSAFTSTFSWSCGCLDLSHQSCLYYSLWTQFQLKHIRETSLLSIGC